MEAMNMNDNLQAIKTLILKNRHYRMVCGTDRPSHEADSKTIARLIKTLTHEEQQDLEDFLD